MTLAVAKGLELPLDAVTQTFAILAKRGAGKSNCAAVMAEEMFAAGLPFVVVDPVGAWYGLRSSRDGKKAGLAIPIFGGRHGDVPLERTGGQLVADVVVDQRLSCVLDVSELSKADRVRFLVDFAERLYRRNRDPLHLFLEEADDFIPQRATGDKARLLGAWDDVVRRGRARGLGMTMITQRSAVLNKDVLTQAETLIALRTTAPQDRKAIGAWVEYHGQADEILGSLAELEDGEAWVWSPHWLRKVERVRFRRRETFDSGATPKHSTRARGAATLADVDLGSLKTRMAETIERAKAEDPRELRARVAALEKELKAARAELARPVEAPPAPDVRALGEIRGLANRVGELAASIATWLDRLPETGPPQGGPTRAATRPEGGRSSAVAAPPAASRPRLARAAPARDGGLTGPEQRILNAIAWLESVGNVEPEQAAVAFLAGYTVGGGAFANPRGALRSKGLVEYASGQRIQLTDAGRVLAEQPAAALTSDDLQARVLERLPGPEARILRVLLDAYPEALGYEDLAARSGYAAGGGAFANPRGRLRSLGLIEYPERGMAVARAMLFLA